MFLMKVPVVVKFIVGFIFLCAIIAFLFYYNINIWNAYSFSDKWIVDTLSSFRPLLYIIIFIAFLFFIYSNIEYLREKNRLEKFRYAIKLRDVGVSYFEKEDYNRALDFFLRAESIFVEVKGERSLEYINTLDNIGLVYMEKKEYDKAFRYFNKARDLLISFEMDNSEEYANTLVYIGTVRYYEGRYKEAIGFIKDAIVIFERLGSFYSLDYAYALFWLGYIYKYKDDSEFEKSYALFEKSMKIYEMNGYVEYVNRIKEELENYFDK